MEFTEEIISEILEDDHPDFTVIEDGEWVNEYGDYDLKETIVHQVSTGKYYRIDQQRRGSYYSDYFYDDPEIIEVKKVVKMIETTIWETV